MSSIEVSLIASDPKMESDTKRSTLRPQRPPPPPPIDQTPIPPELDTSSEPVNDVEKKPSSLLSEFERLFNNFDYEIIREEILNRQMMECNFTTVLWRIFLHCLPRDANQWNDMLDTTRNNYEKLVQQYQIDPYQMSDNNNDTQYVNHPLSRDEKSAWAQFFADEELKGTINIDVRRTCPDIVFFRNPRMIELQLRILFTHSRHHQKTTPYRQGMHEILGIIVYSIYSEGLKVNEDQESNELMKKLYNLQYLEHDAYSIFEKIMDHLRQFYALSTKNSVIRKCASMKDTKQIPFERLNDVHISTNDTVIRMNSIFEHLKIYDRSLHTKLEGLSIEPTVYGIRWLRLLFGREIPFESIPKLWTVIFCFDEHFGFVDYFFIALLIQLGQIIGKQGDIGHTTYLQSLMKQNVITNVEPVIRKALSLTGRQLPPAPEEPVILSVRKTDGTPLDSIDNNQGRAKELQRVHVAPPPKPRLNRPNIPEIRKSTPPPQTNIPNNTTDSMRRSASSTVPFNSTSKSNSSPFSTDSEMDLWAGKTTRQQFEDNLRLQKCCGQYMQKFIERLQQQICDLGASNEDELFIQLSGLKQIANILEGKLTYDGDALQALVNYSYKEKIVEANNSEMN